MRINSDLFSTAPRASESCGFTALRLEKIRGGFQYSRIGDSTVGASDKAHRMYPLPGTANEAHMMDLWVVNLLIPEEPQQLAFNSAVGQWTLVRHVNYAESKKAIEEGQCAETYALQHPATPKVAMGSRRGHRYYAWRIF